MAALLSYALTDLASVKESLNIASSDTSKDNLIIRKINQATRMIENYCGRRFQATQYTNVYYDGTQTDELVLRQRPVLAIDSVGVRDTSLNEDDFEVVETDLYFIDYTAGLVKLDFKATGRWNRYRVTYTAGYYTIPEDIAEAAATLASFLVLNGTSATNIRSKQEGQRKVEYFDPRATSGGGVNSLIDQLGIDEVIAPYANLSLGGI